MSANPLPSLFGRFTAILKDHAHLGVTLHQLRQLCDELEQGGQALSKELAPQALIDDLRSELTSHFAAEESADYFGTVVEVDPTLVQQIATLKSEHLMMLGTLNVLGDLVKDRASWANVPRPARDLIGQLQRHEEAESTLLRDLFQRQA